MNLADAIIFALLAVGDLALMIHLGRRRARRSNLRRVARSLRFAVQRELTGAKFVAPRRMRLLRRAC
jgi:hypothetical protein